ncbi:MAG: two-component response regulator [Candidatus Scalindua rubra]|uniref:Two-component response regulator n=1 Tax=Candidatus Scalindua rubra TaxID=1872076 RepID=A0A1E3X9I8_9BACT|nr:MAG: two-component response regulator [Candidatus Scalindua rubra]
MYRFKILVVDDEIKFCKFLKSFLVVKGYSVDVAYSGKDALEAAAKEEPDVILLDIEMPGMSGMDTLQELRRAGVSAAVIFLTAHVKFTYAVEAIRLNVDDYILKPINNIDVLLAAIRRCTEKLELQKKVKLYEDILPVCCKCQKIRDDTGYEHGTGKWMTMETYLIKRAHVSCSHGYCPECFEEEMSAFATRKAMRKKQHQK